MNKLTKVRTERMLVPFVKSKNEYYRQTILRLRDVGRGAGHRTHVVRTQFAGVSVCIMMRLSVKVIKFKTMNMQGSAYLARMLR